MDKKEEIIQKTIELIKKDGINVSIRKITSSLNISTGIINYYFKSKDELIEECIQSMISQVIDNFIKYKSISQNEKPIDRLCRLGNMTLDFLFENKNISTLSIIGDIKNPHIGNNTDQTIKAYESLIREILPLEIDKTIKEKTVCLINIMQNTFINRDIISKYLNINLYEKDERHKYHNIIINRIMETKK